MPETDTIPKPTELRTETPGQRVMRQWYQGKLAERLMQAGQMAMDRTLLRRGSRKMQDGALGQQAGTASAEEEPVNISVGDQVHYHQASTSVEQTAGATRKGLVAKALPYVLTALLGTAGGAGVSALVAQALRPDQDAGQPQAGEYVDTSTEIGIGGGEPTLEW